MREMGNLSLINGENDNQAPLVSVVITCYNHAHYLEEAIESVRGQTYTHFEVIVVDDGSTDHTEAVAHNFPNITYIKQDNKGLSTARNTGLQASQGDYIVFLDADDLLLPGALKINVACFKGDIPYAFVAGGHIKITNEGESLPSDPPLPLQKQPYSTFLRGNFIGMHAAVMYNKKILLQSGGFDASLRACEDYEVYFRLSKSYPVYNHQQLIASYRIHGENMSANIPLMLKNVYHVLQMQVADVNERGLLRDYQAGIKNWEDYYMTLYVTQLREKYARLRAIPIRKWHPVLTYGRSWAWRKSVMKMKNAIKRVMPISLKRSLYRMGLLKYFVPPVGRVRWGDLRQTIPFSTQFGFDRGGPVDRYYIEKFLSGHSGAIAGRVLEIGDNVYTLRFGESKVTTSDILHVKEGNPKATFVGDLATANHIPSNTFDCIILTQTLHLIYNYKEALKTCFRILKPGGSLLLTVPGISQIEQGEWTDLWLWSFTEKSIRLVVGEVLPNAALSVEKYGNVLAASAFLYGIGSIELTREELDGRDPHYQVLIGAKITKRKEV